VESCRCGRKLLAADEQLGPAVVDDVLQLGQGQPTIQRQQDEPGANGRDMELKILSFVLRQQGNDIAGVQGPVAEQPNQATGPGIQLREREATLRVDYRRMIRRMSQGVGQQVGYEAHGSRTLSQQDRSIPPSIGMMSPVTYAPLREHR
jgi:hypothetical protein